jgi:plastocyanin
MQQSPVKFALLPVLALGFVLLLLSTISAANPQQRTNPSMPTFHSRRSPPLAHQAPLITTTVELTNNTFSPLSVTIQVGESVSWRRVNGFHNVHADDNSFRLGGANGAPSSSWITVSHAFTQVGTVRYYCEVHGAPNGGGMAGIVIVQASDSAEKRVYLPVVQK